MTRTTPHKIVIMVDNDCNLGEWQQRIIDCVPENNYVYRDRDEHSIIVVTWDIYATIDALKNDGFTI